jgi:hypothetical protein
MSKNDMVMVPRDAVENAAELLQEYNKCRIARDLRAILDQPAQQHQGEPVGMLRGSRRVCHCCVGMDREEWCSICDSAAGTEVERLRAQLDERDHQLGLIGTCLGEILVAAKHIRAGVGLTGPQLLQFGEELRDCLSASAEPSAPVEIDERARFEKAVIDKAERFHPNLEQYGEHPEAEYRDPKIEWAWGLWQARAALERKP